MKRLLALPTLLSLLILAPTVAHGQDPSADGSVLTISTTLTGLRRPDGKDSSLEVLHPASPSQRSPVVLFVHGWSAAPDTYRSTLENLASRGFAVAAFDQIDLYETRLELWRGAAIGAIDALEAATNDPQSPLYDQLDMDRLVLMGHSYGGATTLCVAATDPRVKVAVALTPGCQEDQRPLLLRLAARVRVPTLIVGGEWDFLTHPSTFARPAYDQVPATQKLYVELARTSHLPISDYGMRFRLFSLSHGGWTWSTSTDEVHRLTRRYANAWIEHHLGVRRDGQGYVDGRQAAADHQANRLSRYFR